MTLSSRSRPRVLVAALFAFGILLYVAHLLDKSLQPFAPVGIVLLVLAVNRFRRPDPPRDHPTSRCKS